MNGTLNRDGIVFPAVQTPLTQHSGVQRHDASADQLLVPLHSSSELSGAAAGVSQGGRAGGAVQPQVPADVDRQAREQRRDARADKHLAHTFRQVHSRLPEGGLRVEGGQEGSKTCSWDGMKVQVRLRFTAG